MKLQRLRRRANLNRDHSLKNPRTFDLSYLRADECSWKKIDQVSSAATDHCTSTAVSSARKARSSTRSFRFALFKYKYNIHLAFVNIGWYLARDHDGPRCARSTSSIFASPAAHQICRLGQPCAPRAIWHSLNISRYSLALGEYC